METWKIILLVLIAWFVVGVLLYLSFYIKILYFTKIQICKYRFQDFVLSGILGPFNLIFHIKPNDTYLK